MNFQTRDDDGGFRAADGAGAEIARAVRISLCGLDLGRPASFLPASLATADYDWQAWLRGSFCKVLGGVFVQVFQAAGLMQVREALEIDRGLDGIGGVGGEASRAAGEALFERLGTAKDLRVVGKMRGLLDGGGGPNFVTAFAVECAEFHLPLRAALLSYLYGEWRCGMSALGERGDLEAFAASGGAVLTRVVGEVIARDGSPFGHAANF